MLGKLIKKKDASKIIEIKQEKPPVKPEPTIPLSNNNKNTDFLEASIPSIAAMEMIIDKLPEVAKLIEESTVNLSNKFQELATLSSEKSKQMDKIIDIAGSLNVNDEKISLDSFAKLFNSTLSDAIDKILQVSKLAMSMVYSLDDTLKSIREIENITGRIQAVNKQTNLLALNAAIESEKAGENGKGFNVVAKEMRAISNEVAILSKEITHKIELVGKHSKESFEILKNVATTDMTSNMDAKERLDLLIQSLLKQSDEFKVFLEESSQSSKTLSDNISSMTIGIQFQDRTSQYIENSVNTLKVISEHLRGIKNQTVNNMEKSIEIDRSFINKIISSIKLSEFRQKFLSNLSMSSKVKNAEQLADILHKPDSGKTNTGGKEDNVELF